MDALRLGPFVLPWGPLILVLGYAAAVWVAGFARNPDRSHKQGDAEPALLPLLVFALIAARAGFVLRHGVDVPGHPLASPQPARARLDPAHR